MLIAYFLGCLISFTVFAWCSLKKPVCFNVHIVSFIVIILLCICILSVGVLAVSWYPPSQADGQGHSWDDFMLPLMDIAQKYKLKVTFGELCFT